MRRKTIKLISVYIWRRLGLRLPWTEQRLPVKDQPNPQQSWPRFVVSKPYILAQLHVKSIMPQPGNIFIHMSSSWAGYRLLPTAQTTDYSILCPHPTVFTNCALLGLQGQLHKDDISAWSRLRVNNCQIQLICKH